MRRYPLHYTQNPFKAAAHVQSKCCHVQVIRAAAQMSIEEGMQLMSVADVARASCSHRYITTHTACQTWDNTVWTEGIRKPWATPTASLARIIAELLAADPGVSIEAVDHKPKETMSMRRPPQRCAAQPPGTCTASTVDDCLHQGH